jgi:hypothetical protein
MRSTCACVTLVATGLPYAISVWQASAVTKKSHVRPLSPVHKNAHAPTHAHSRRVNCLLTTIFSKIPTKRVLQSWGVSTTDGRQTRTTWVCRKRCEKSMGATKRAKNPCRGEQEYALVRILPLGASAAGLSDGTPRS